MPENHKIMWVGGLYPALRDRRRYRQKRLPGFRNVNRAGAAKVCSLNRRRKAGTKRRRITVL